jgi:hypothetical protein
MNINQFLNLGVNGLLKGIVPNGSCIEFGVEVKFGNNEVKMLKNQINNHHVQKDTFEFIEDGDHEPQDQCSL